MSFFIGKIFWVFVTFVKLIYLLCFLQYLVVNTSVDRRLDVQSQPQALHLFKVLIHGHIWMKYATALVYAHSMSKLDHPDLVPFALNL